MFVPNWTEHGEPRGVNCTTRKPLSKAKSASKPPPQAPVEALGAFDVGDRNDDDLELQIDRRSGGDLCGVFIVHLCAAHCDLDGLVVSRIPTRWRWHS